jgi:hypothetical protein
MMIIFFSGLHLVMLKALPPGTRFNQEYFTDEILPGIVNERQKNSAEFSEDFLGAQGQFHVSQRSNRDR